MSPEFLRSSHHAQNSFSGRGYFWPLRFSRSCPGTSRSRFIGRLLVLSRRIQQRSERQRGNGGFHRIRQPLARGITGDFGAYHASPFGVSANTYTFLVGPRFSYRHSERAAPFAQVLVGGAHLTAGATGISASTSGFAWSAGGGIDLGLSRHLAFRPQFDYIGIHAAGGTLNSARASASVVYR